MTPRLSRLFLLITLVGVLHMGEQLMTSIEEFYWLGDLVVRWQALFPIGMEGQSSVALITFAFLIVSLLIYAALRGGTSAVLVMGAFGALGVAEAHHVVEALLEGGYDPGVITSIAYVAVGVLILRETALTLRGRPVAAI